MQVEALTATTWQLAPRWNDRETEAVPVVEPPGIEEFRKTWVDRRRPVVLRGWARRWRAVEGWTFESLTARFGDRRVPVVRVKDGLLGYDESAGMDYETKSIVEFLRGVGAGGPPEWFLMVRPAEHFPELLPELQTFAYSRDAVWRDSRVTIGAPGTTTPIHREIADNLFSVVSGEKEVVLFARRDTPNLYSLGPFSGAPHLSPVDPRTFEFLRYPRIRRCKPFRCIVRSGDALFIPRGMWHAVRTNEPTIAVGNWWADGLYSYVPRAAGLYKRLMSLKT